MSFPSAQLEGAIYADLILPALLVEATGLIGEVGDADLTLPVLIVEAGQIGVDLAFPAFAVEAEAAQLLPNFVDASLVLSGLVIASTALTGNIADAAVQISFSVQGFASIQIDYQASLALLPLVLEAYATQALPENYHGMVMNLAHQGVSEYRDLAFNSLCRFNGVNLGADSRGIHALEGDRDEAAPIESDVATGITDMGANLLKRVTDAYLGLKAEGSYEFLTLSDDNRETTYAFSDGETASHVRKQDLGKGIKSKYWGFRFKNVDGADFELQLLRVRADANQRRK